MASHPDFSHWFYTNYIQVIWQTNFHVKHLGELNIFDFYLNDGQTVDSPLLTNKIVQTDEITAPDSADLLKGFLDNGFVIYAFVDEFYIPERFAYKKMHWVHDILVNGYDDTERSFKVIGYNARMIYQASSVGYEAFANSLHSANQQNSRPLHLLRVNPEGSYLFDPRAAKDNLLLYLYEEKKQGDYVIGKSGSRFFLSYLDLLADNQTLFDIRPFHLYWEHKRCMLERVQYLEEHVLKTKGWSDSYCRLVKNAQHIRNLFIKYRMTRQTAVLEGIRSDFMQLEKEEHDILTRMVQQIC